MFCSPPFLPPSHLSSRKTMLVFALQNANWFQIVHKRWSQTYFCIPAYCSMIFHDSNIEQAPSAQGRSFADRPTEGNQREMLSISSQQLTQWLLGFLSWFPFSGFFRGHFPVGQICVLSHRKQWVSQALGMGGQLFLEANIVMKGRDGWCIDTKHLIMESGSWAGDEDRRPPLLLRK